MDREGIRCGYLRGVDETANQEVSRCREVDLLVLPDHLSRLRDVLAQHGFVEMPCWGHAPHHFFIAYDEQSDAWCKLDVVTDLRYGRPLRVLRAGDPKATLLRCGPDHLLARDEEFTGLLLHCLLDRGAFLTRHRARLLALWREFHYQPEIGCRAIGQVEQRLAPAITWHDLSRAIPAQDWHSLLKRQGVLARQLFWKDPAMTVCRQLSGYSLRALRPLLFSLRRRGAAITLLGPDGVGKTTLGRALAEEKPLRARFIYMGTNLSSADVALPTTRWLERRKAANVGRLLGPTALLLKWLGFANRLAEHWYRYSIAHYHQLRGRLVVFDRYPYEHRVTSKVTTLRKRLRARLVKTGAPKPRAIFVLDAPVEILQQRKNEHTPERLAQMRQAYLDLPSRVPEARVIDTTMGAGAVRRSVTSAAWKILGEQWRRLRDH